MSNIIRINKDTPINQWVCMSNGCTSAVIDVIGLSGTRLAVTDEEKLMMVWLLEKDQSCRGIGTVGFDLVEMPWHKKDFTHQKDFIIKVLDNVYQKLGWEVLDYTPNEEIIFNCIDQLKQLVVHMTVEDINEQERQEWLDASDDEEPIKNGFPVCAKHHMLLSIFGCHACNN